MVLYLYGVAVFVFKKMEICSYVGCAYPCEVFTDRDKALARNDLRHHMTLAARANEAKDLDLLQLGTRRQVLLDVVGCAIDRVLGARLAKSSQELAIGLLGGGTMILEEILQSLTEAELLVQALRPCRGPVLALALELPPPGY